MATTESPIRFVLVTGMSGAGKTIALKALEDIGYEAVDNIPLTLLPLLVQTDHQTSKLVAVGVDIRNRDFSLRRFEDKLILLKNRKDLQVEVIFLDCEDEVLLRRFSETRRKHPMDDSTLVLDNIKHEREMMNKLRIYADYVVDSTHLSLPDLRHWIKSHFTPPQDRLPLTLTVRSFSYRQGVPREADIIFDVRFLRNPHYDEKLRPLTGQDARVAEYIKQDEAFSLFFQNVCNMILPLLPRYKEEGKSYLTIAFGCTGGQHRSVFLAEAFRVFLAENGYEPNIDHRELRPQKPITLT